MCLPCMFMCTATFSRPGTFTGCNILHCLSALMFIWNITSSHLAWKLVFVILGHR